MTLLALFWVFPHGFWSGSRLLLWRGYFSPHYWEWTHWCLQRWCSVTALVPVTLAWLAPLGILHSLLSPPSAPCSLCKLLCSLLHDLENQVWPETSQLRTDTAAQKVTVELTCGHVHFALESSATLFFLCVMLVRASWASVWPVSLFPLAQGCGWQAVSTHTGPQPPCSRASQYESLQLGTLPRLAARAAACIRVGGCTLLLFLSGVAKALVVHLKRTT